MFSYTLQQTYVNVRYVLYLFITVLSYGWYIRCVCIYNVRRKVPHSERVTFKFHLQHTNQSYKCERCIFSVMI